VIKYKKLTGVTLPNLDQWHYTYNNEGSLESVTTPLGATFSYTYTTINAQDVCDTEGKDLSCAPCFGSDKPEYCAKLQLASKTITGAGLTDTTWTYDVHYNTTNVTTTVTSPLRSDVYTYYRYAQTAVNANNGLLSSNGLIKNHKIYGPGSPAHLFRNTDYVYDIMKNTGTIYPPVPLKPLGGHDQQNVDHWVVALPKYQGVPK
jgi:YD repeat-containing protein